MGQTCHPTLLQDVKTPVNCIEQVSSGEFTWEDVAILYINEILRKLSGARLNYTFMLRDRQPHNSQRNKCGTSN